MWFAFLFTRVTLIFLLRIFFPSAYMINITGATVGNDSIAAILSALVDSGTSFTYLADPLYTKLTQSVR